MGILDAPVGRKELNTKFVRKDSVFINAKDNGVKGDARKFSTGGAIASGSANLTLTGATFLSTDVGKLIYVLGAGAAGTVLATTISGFTDATHITLTANASTTVTTASVIYGWDDTAAIQAILDGMQNYGISELLLPFGSYLVDTLKLKNNTVIRGQQRGAWAYEFPERTTRILAKPGMVGTSVITDYTTSSQVGNVRLFDFMIDGNKAFQTSSKTGIYLGDSTISADSLWTIERVYVGYMSGDGAYFGAYRRANRVNDSHFFQCAGNGIRVEGTDNSFMQTVFAQNSLDGLLLNQGANHFYGCDIFSNIGHGANIAALGRMNQFTNCFFDSNSKCGVYNLAKNLSLVQCRFATNSQVTDGLYPDVDISGGPSGCAVINPTFYLIAGSANLPHSGVRASGNNYANLVYMIGFSHDPGVTTWRSGSYVEASFGFLHKGFTLADGAKIGTGGVNGTVFGGATDKVAFFGKSAGIALPTGTPAAATDAATTQTLVNDLRTKLLALGLIS